MLYTAISILHVCICVFLVLLVLLQQGKGADAGATFGGGSNTLFGAGGADTFLTKATTILAFLFMSTSFALALSAMPASDGKSSTKLFQNVQTEKPQAAPAEPAAAASSESSSVGPASDASSASMMNVQPSAVPPVGEVDGQKK
jgi:preprotein translocase subunit SecG